MESEYTNPTELLGLNGEMDTELLGYLNALNPVQRAKAMSKIVKRHIPSQGSRAEFEKFFVELPKQPGILMIKFAVSLKASVDF